MSVRLKIVRSTVRSRPQPRNAGNELIHSLVLLNWLELISKTSITCKDSPVRARAKFLEQFHKLQSFPKSLIIFLILFVSILLRVLAHFLLPPTITTFALDESAYSSLAEWVSQKKNVYDFPSYGASLYYGSQSLIIPSSILVKFGFDGLQAVRLVSLLYGILSLLLFTYIVLQITSKNNKSYPHFSNARVIILVAIYGFLPSHLLWSILGLRESSSEFWLLFSWALLLRVKSPSLKLLPRIFIAALASFSTALAFSARYQTAIVFMVSIGLALIFVNIQVASVFVLLSLLLGFFLGNYITTAPTIESKSRLVAVPLLGEGISSNLKGGSSSREPTSQLTEGIKATNFKSSKSSVAAQLTDQSQPKPKETPSEIQVLPSENQSQPKPKETPSEIQVLPSEKSSNVPTESSLSKKCKRANQILIEFNGKYICKNVEVKIKVTTIANSAKSRTVDSIGNLEDRRNLNTIGAASALPHTNCRVSSVQFVERIICNFSEIPMRVTSFLFRPFIVLDQGSSGMLVASYENLCWLLLILFFILRLWKNRLGLLRNEILSSSASFIFFFTLGSALYEGNLGTAFRHKAILLPFLLICIASTQKTEDTVALK